MWIKFFIVLVLGFLLPTVALAEGQKDNTREFHYLAVHKAKVSFHIGEAEFAMRRLDGGGPPVFVLYIRLPEFSDTSIWHLSQKDGGGELRKFGQLFFLGHGFFLKPNKEEVGEQLLKVLSLEGNMQAGQYILSGGARILSKYELVKNVIIESGENQVSSKCAVPLETLSKINKS